MLFHLYVHPSIKTIKQGIVICTTELWHASLASLTLRDVSLDKIILKYTAARREGYAYLFNCLKISFC